MISSLMMIFSRLLFGLLSQAHSGGRLVGAVVGKAEPKKGRMRGYIAMLAVDSTVRKHGLGLRLAATVVQQMTETCEEVGRSELQLTGC